MEGYGEENTNLYVKGLPTYFTEEQVIAVFQDYGSVASARYMPAPAGRSDATALVRMATLQEAHNAIAALNGAVVGGANVGAMMVRYHGPVSAPPSDNLYVKGLPSFMSEELLGSTFSAYGAILSMRLMQPRPPAEDCTALVRMGSVEEATAAMQSLNGTMAPGAVQSQLVVRFADTPNVKEDKVQRWVQQQQPEQWAMQPSSPYAAPRTMRAPQTVPPPAMAAPRPLLDHAAWSPAGAPLILEVRYHGPRNAPPSDNLYVKGLLPTHQKEDLIRIFSVCGNVVSVRIMPAATDATAMVRMSSVEEAASAIAQLDGRPIETEADAAAQLAGAYQFRQPVAVVPPMESSRHAWMPSETAWNGASAAMDSPLVVRYHGPPNAPPSDNLYVKGLPRDITQEDVQHIFQSFGNVISTRVMPGERDAASLVRMSSEEEATLAISMLHGAPLSLGQDPEPLMPAPLPHRSMPTTTPRRSMPTNMPHRSTAMVVPPPAAMLRQSTPTVVPPPASMLPQEMTFAETGQPPAATGLLVRYHGARNAPPSDNLYVKGLPAGCSEGEVRALFGSYGSIISVRVMLGAGDATALVRMGSIEEASTAIQFLNSVHDPVMGKMPGARWSDGVRASPY